MAEPNIGFFVFQCDFDQRNQGHQTRQHQMTSLSYPK